MISLLVFLITKKSKNDLINASVLGLIFEKLMGIEMALSIHQEILLCICLEELYGWQ